MIPSAARVVLRYCWCAAAAAVLALAVAARPAADSPGLSPLAVFDTWLDAQARQAMAEGARARGRIVTGADARRHADAVRARMRDAMGGLPADRTPLNARITGRLDRDGYRIEALVFESLPGIFVTGSLYVPDGTGPFPALLGTAGHSVEGRAAALYQHVWATMARRGVLVLAYDPPGQGERLEYLDPQTGTSRIGVGTPEHSHAGQQCLLTGTSIARYFVHDGIRALDYLLTRPDVDPARLGVAGNSGGGTQAAWLGALEPRLNAINSSCYITSWKELWAGPGPQDMEQVLPGFLARGLDFPDMIAAAAPRPYLVSNAIRDYFPIAGARETVAWSRWVYGLLDAGDRLGHFTFDDEHGWSQPRREAAYRWFGRWWLDGRGSHPEEDVVIETPEALRATPTGQVATSFEARTIFDVNRERALELARTRPPVTVPRLRALLGVAATTPPAAIVRRARGAAVGGLRTERLAIAPAAGLELPARLIHPEGTPRGTVVVADGREPEADAVAVGAGWARRGYLALVVDVRGAGALAPARGESGYSSDYQLAARAWLLGTSVVAWQTQDLVAALALLEREQPAVEARALHAAGITAPAAIFAAALHPVRTVRIEAGIVSYLDLATTRDYRAPARVFVPGVLATADLADAMALAAPAAIELVRPVRADGDPVASEAALAELLGRAVPAHVMLDAGGSGSR